MPVGSGDSVNGCNGSVRTVINSMEFGFMECSLFFIDGIGEEVKFIKEEESVLTERLRQLRSRRHELQGSDSSSSSSSESSSGCSSGGRGRAFGVRRCRDRPNRSPSGPRGRSHKRRHHRRHSRRSDASSFSSSSLAQWQRDGRARPPASAPVQFARDPRLDLLRVSQQKLDEEEDVWVNPDWNEEKPVLVLPPPPPAAPAKPPVATDHELVPFHEFVLARRNYKNPLGYNLVISRPSHLEAYKAAVQIARKCYEEGKPIPPLSELAARTGKPSLPYRPPSGSPSPIPPSPLPEPVVPSIPDGVLLPQPEEKPKLPSPPPRASGFDDDFLLPSLSSPSSSPDRLGPYLEGLVPPQRTLSPAPPSRAPQSVLIKEEPPF